MDHVRRTPEDIAAARAQLRAAEAMVDLSRTQLSHTRLIAPANGMIMTRVIEPGTVVLPATNVYSMALDDEVWVRSFAPEPLLPRVAPGSEVTLAADGVGRTYRGRIGCVSPAAEFTPKTVETRSCAPSLSTGCASVSRIPTRRFAWACRSPFGCPPSNDRAGRRHRCAAPRLSWCAGRFVACCAGWSVGHDPARNDRRTCRTRRRRQDHVAASDRRIASPDRRSRCCAWPRHGHRRRFGTSGDRLHATALRPVRGPERGREPRPVRRSACHDRGAAHRACAAAAAFHRSWPVHRTLGRPAFRRDEAETRSGLCAAVAAPVAAAR
jgi:hypothetical protein